MIARRTRARREDIKKALKQRFISVGGVRLYYKEVVDKKITAAVVTFGVKRAVDRNKIKRLVREAFWLAIKKDSFVAIRGGVFVLMANLSLIKTPFIEIQKQIKELLDRVDSK